MNPLEIIITEKTQNKPHNFVTNSIKICDIVTKFYHKQMLFFICECNISMFEKKNTCCDGTSNSSI